MVMISGDQYSYDAYGAVLPDLDAPTAMEWVCDGSGGTLSRFFSDASGSAGAFDVFPDLAVTGGPEDDRAGSHVERMLDVIADVFVLNHTQLARVCGLKTRAALYDWRKGVHPRKDALLRLERLYRAALDWRRSGFPRSKEALHLSILDGRSLLDLLTDSPLDLDAIDFAGERLALGPDTVITRRLEDPFS